MGLRKINIMKSKKSFLKIFLLLVEHENKWNLYNTEYPTQ